MVYGSIQTHHGAIEIGSTLDEATSAQIYLPLIDATESQSTVSEQPAPKAEKSAKILLVDDYMNIRDYYVSNCETWNIGSLPQATVLRRWKSLNNKAMTSIWSSAIS